jgi:hypothetical protein
LHRSIPPEKGDELFRKRNLDKKLFWNLSLFSATAEVAADDISFLEEAKMWTISLFQGDQIERIFYI